MNTNDEIDGSFTTSFSSNSSTSLVSTLDHRLHFMTKYMEQKRESSKWGSDGEVSMTQKDPMPLELAVEEVQSKGSLLDRIASLEARLVQLCLLIESKAASPSTSSEIQQTLPESRKPSSPYSLSRLRLSSRKAVKQTSQVSTDKIPVADLNQEDRKSMNNEGFTGKKIKNCTANKSAKREGTSGCLHFRLLGC
ncbi:hypothetical protein RND81_13G014600 [Saponaria officinalis]|uniref:Uncharacterized protein n=1 Tax=Saponaria officinalis TaxID=3572 RepID=A0AAW1GV06_SAPOF